MSGDVIEALQQWGCDTVGALRRTMDDRDFYLALLHQYLQEWDLSALRHAVETADASTAFSLAHSAKGVLGNLGITPLYQSVSALTDILRANSCDGASPLLETIACYRAQLVQLLDSHRQ